MREEGRGNRTIFESKRGTKCKEKNQGFIRSELQVKEKEIC